MRGLKFDYRAVEHGTQRVALFVSAWIEILQSNQEIVDFTVALFVSAWIEIWYNVGDDDTQLVALFVSAWIEIGLETSILLQSLQSHSL